MFMFGDAVGFRVDEDLDLGHCVVQRWLVHVQ